MSERKKERMKERKKEEMKKDRNDILTFIL